MKRLVLFLTAVLMATAIMAQGITNPKNDDRYVNGANQTKTRKGAFFVGGTAEIGYSGTFNLAIEPIFGYEFNDRVAIGTGIGPVYSEAKGISDVVGVVEPFVRLCAWHNDIVFIDFKVTAGVGFNNELILVQTGVRPSLRVRLNEHWEVSADLGLFGAQCVYGDWTPVVGIGATSAGVWFAYRF